MTMLPRFYCTTCRKFKHRWEVNRKDDTRCYWYICKWCHKPVDESVDVIEAVLCMLPITSEVNNG